MFIVSTKKFDSYKQKIDNYYVNYDEYVKVIETQDYFLLFEGYLYPDINYNLKDIVNYFFNEETPNSFKKFKGNYCGVFYNRRKEKIIFFNDQLGLSDVYYLHKNNILIITNFFNNFLKILKPKI